MDKIEYYDFNAPLPGPRLVVTGRMHGNEPAGTVGIERAMKEIRDGSLRLTSGSVRFIPVCNPRAKLENKRYCEVNLNRVFEPKASPKLYEELLAQELIKLEGKPDMLLDLHSDHTRGKTFAHRDIIHPLSDIILKYLPVPVLISGWPELYRSLGIMSGGGDSISYMGTIGTTGICLETGQHDDPEAGLLAYDAIIITLSLMKMIREKVKLPAKPARHLRYFDLIRYKAGSRFEKEWKSFDELAAGTRIGTLIDGTPVVAPCDCSIVFPFPTAKPGDEWFFLAKEEALF